MPKKRKTPKPIDLQAPRTLKEAVDSISERTPIGGILRTAEWKHMPLALRQRAFFSAGVYQMQFLNEAKEKLERRINLERGALKMNRARFIGDLRTLADEMGMRTTDPKLREGLQDIGSVRRLELIYDTQISMANGYANWKRKMDPEMLQAFPAQELIRVSSRKVPRQWERRWVAAGGKFYAGRMAALRTDPVWRRISRFGTPYPPFDFNSGMGLRQLSRLQAEDLGLLGPDEELTPDTDDFNEALEASVRDLSADDKQMLENFFGDQVDLTGEVIRWVADKTHNPYLNFKQLGLDDAAEWTGAAALPKIVDPDIARDALEQNVEVQTFTGARVKYETSIENHWQVKGYSEKQIRDRLQRIGMATETLENPDEIIAQKKQHIYTKVFVSGEGKKIWMQVAVRTDENVVRSFIPKRKAKEVNMMRTGHEVIFRRKMR